MADKITIIKRTLKNNSKELAENIYTPDLSGWSCYIHGNYKYDDIYIYHAPDDKVEKVLQRNGLPTDEWAIRVDTVPEFDDELLGEIKDTYKEKGKMFNLYNDVLSKHIEREIDNTWNFDKYITKGKNHIRNNGHERTREREND